MTVQSARCPSARRIIWSCAFLLSLGLHASIAATLILRAPAPVDASDDVGAAMTLELSPLPASQAADDTGEPAPDSPESVAAPSAPPVPEVEERLSTQAANDQPKADSSPYESEETLSRKETEKKDENKPDEKEATNESKPEAAQPAAAVSAAPSTAGAEPSRDDEHSASPKEGTTLEAHEAPMSWQRVLMSHLGKHKRYPPQARKQKQTGTAMIEFTMSRDGTIQSARLVNSSGAQLLDEESLAMLKRASPLPTLPRDISASAVHVVLPVRYRLN